ncbi:MAG: hypothetical protein ACJA00_005098, partial [Myxococcota bacterium]
MLSLRRDRLEAGGRVVLNPDENVDEGWVGVDALEQTGPDERVASGGRLCAALGADVQPVTCVRRRPSAVSRFGRRPLRTRQSPRHGLPRARSQLADRGERPAQVSHVLSGLNGHVTQPWVRRRSYGSECPCRSTLARGARHCGRSTSSRMRKVARGQGTAHRDIRPPQVGQRLRSTANTRHNSPAQVRYLASLPGFALFDSAGRCDADAG